MSSETRDLVEKWDWRHRQAGSELPMPARVLSEFHFLLPAAGRALDLACGRGGSAILMAECGLDVHAWDISPVAVEWLRNHALQADLPIKAVARDVVRQPPEPGEYDVVVVSYFLDRSICPSIVNTLRPGGLLFYQTFAVDAVTDTGPSNPEFRLAGGELLRLFAGLTPKVFSDLGSIGDTSAGVRDISWLVARK